tara:strand:+ start:224 stop:376 length:153 start_codon:yes stop_codon:yes gene_type:complete
MGFLQQLATPNNRPKKEVKDGYKIKYIRVVDKKRPLIFYIKRYINPKNWF